MRFTALALALMTSSTTFAQYWANTPGAAPVVAQIGTGVPQVSGTGYLTLLKQFQPGVASQTTPTAFAQFPSATSSPRLVLTIGTVSEGLLTNSVDRSQVTLAGYDAASGTAGVAGATVNANRVVGYAELSPTGLTGAVQIANSTTQATAYTAAGTIRSAVALGGPTSDTWTGGTSNTASTAGVRFINTNTQVSSTVTNIRSVDIYNNQLFASSASGAFTGIGTVGTGTPTSPGTTISLLIDTGAGSSPYEFVGLLDSRLPVTGLPANAAGNNLFYIADDRGSASGGIQRWAWNGTAFALDYTINGGGLLGARGLSGYTDPLSGNSVLYTTTSNGTQLLQYTDTGTVAGANASQILLATSPTNTVFRGVALAVPEPGLLGLATLGFFALRRRVSLR